MGESAHVQQLLARLFTSLGRLCTSPVPYAPELGLPKLRESGGVSRHPLKQLEQHPQSIGGFAAPSHPVHRPHRVDHLAADRPNYRSKRQNVVVQQVPQYFFELPSLGTSEALLWTSSQTRLALPQLRQPPESNVPENSARGTPTASPVDAKTSLDKCQPT